MQPGCQCEGFPELVEKQGLSKTRREIRGADLASRVQRIGWLSACRHVFFRDGIDLQKAPTNVDATSTEAL